MSVHQHYDLFYPLGWGSDWVYHKLGNLRFSGPGQVLGSYVVNQVFAIPVVQ